MATAGTRSTLHGARGHSAELRRPLPKDGIHPFSGHSLSCQDTVMENRWAVARVIVRTTMKTLPKEDSRWRRISFVSFLWRSWNLIFHKATHTVFNQKLLWSQEFFYLNLHWCDQCQPLVLRANNVMFHESIRGCWGGGYTRILSANMTTSSESHLFWSQKDKSTVLAINAYKIMILKCCVKGHVMLQQL